MEAEYRVEEYDGVFQIQRKEFKTKITGMLWWIKITKEAKWSYVDKWGICLWRSYRTGLNNTERKIEPFNDLKSALVKIEVMIKGETHHYPK